MFLAPVAAPVGKTGGTPPNTKCLELREWESIVGKILHFLLNFSKIFITIFLEYYKKFLKAFKICN